MKNKLLALAVLAAFSCNPKEKDSLSVAGVYNMLSQSVNDGTKDSAYNRKQLKIYTDDYMMYANINAIDSTASFGIGSYNIDSGKVVEFILYSASGDATNPDPRTYRLDIEKTPKGYKQTIADIMMQGKNYKLSEEYESIGNTAKSPLDGEWSMTSHYRVKGNDTINNEVTEYKVYYGGHFIFGRSARDTVTHKSKAGIGFGTFEMANNKVKESIIASNYQDLVGKTFDLDIEFSGTDEFKQTITIDTLGKSIEVYKRLKK